MELKAFTMKNLIVLFFIFVSLQLFAQQMNVVSYNIRYNTPNDGVNAWPNRIEMVTGLLKFHEADIFGLQEALHGQITDIADRMPEFKWFGTGRDDGKQGGEYSPIFYDTRKFELLETVSSGFQKPPMYPPKPGMLPCQGYVHGENSKPKKTAGNSMFSIPISIISAIRHVPVQLS
jgi:hypothetical protein